MGERATPIRQQYLQIKRKYPDAIVLFRLGDFYETFDDDARTASRELEIVLTSREMGKGNKVPLAGIPYHALDNYLARLISRGYKVAICEQVTRPGETRGLVEREVVRLVTPGTVVEPALLDGKKNNYLVSLASGGENVGLACIDITTSEFAVTELPVERLATELERLKPAEIIAAESAELELSLPVTRVHEYWFEPEAARETLQEHFGVATLEGYGCAHLPLAVGAAGAIIRYIRETQKTGLGQITRLSTYSTGSFMALDVQTQRNLELFQSSRTGSAQGSLLAVLDRTRTAGGGRLLKKWLGQPLLDIKELKRRQDAIDWFVEHSMARTRAVSLLGNVADLERLTNRVRGGIAVPRELVSLKRSLELIPELGGLLAAGDGDGAVWPGDRPRPCPEICALIGESLVDDPSTAFGAGQVIRTGFSPELDDLRGKSRNARQYLANLERQERERTGIKSLKIGFNNVFGYYIEVSRPNLEQVPADYIRKQTLVGGERFFTAELKEYESLILHARDRIAGLEAELFRRVCRQVGDSGDRILTLADVLAHLDVFSSLAGAAVDFGYVRPVLSEGDEIRIRQGRHPVVERTAARSGFVPNDTCLSNAGAQLIVLTGPNMSGKSTYLRQVALIVLLAQMGSFVPAESASIGVVDRIFTRIGAGEDIAAGQSTFMVEMMETAGILNNATPRSLIVLDEIGRGTSTYDGLSIARAVAEYIHNHPGLGAKTLFATHYHEMVALAGYLPRVRNFNVAVKEEGGEVTFLYRIVPGGVDRSYGIHVAQLAGLPRAVIHRAREVLEELEGGGRAYGAVSGKRRRGEPVRQMPLFGQKSPVLEELEKLDPDGMTPLEALNKLYELKKKVRED